MSSKHEINNTGKGFSIKPTQAYQEKQVREERINNNKSKQKSTYTNAELFQMMCDIADRQSEIYDMIKLLK